MAKIKRIIAISLCGAMMAPSMAFAADSPAKISVSSATSGTYTYSAKEKTAGIVVNGKKLTLGKDFKVTSGSLKATDAGTYKVKIEGIGNYTGTKTVSYTIKAKAVETTVSISNMTYSGTKKTAKAVVKTAAGTTLKAGTDYTITGNTHLAAGKYKVVVKGKGNYSFTKTVYYRVNARAVSKTTVKAASKTYNGKKQTTSVTVKYGSKKLVKGTDYKISGVTKATNAGKYTVKVTGIGNYTGTKTVTYVINKASQKSVKVKVNSSTKRIAVTGVKGSAKVTYKTNNSKVKVSGKKIIVSKGVKKGTKVTITVKVAATKNYKAYTKKVTYTVK